MVIKPRIIKKLSKKAAEYVPDCIFDPDQGLYGIWHRPSSWEYDEWEFKNAWEELRELYQLAFTDFSEDDLKYFGKRATPANVFKWAKNERI